MLLPSLRSDQPAAGAIAPDSPWARGPKTQRMISPALRQPVIEVDSQIRRPTVVDAETVYGWRAKAKVALEAIKGQETVRRTGEQARTAPDPDCSLKT